MPGPDRGSRQAPINHPYSRGIMKRVYPASFATPMQIGNPMQRNGSSYRKRRRTTNNYSGGRSGPYRSLTSNSRHTHPVYPRPEVKFVDFAQSNVAGNVPFDASVAALPMLAAGNMFVLNAIPQSIASNGRIGTKVAVRNCTYRYELDLPATGAVPCSGRVVILWDKQGNGATNAGYLWSAVFTDASYLAFMNMGNTDRFTILRNQQFSLSPNGDQVLFFEGFVKINMESTWLQAAASGSPQSGTLLCAFISDQPTMASAPTIRGCWRTRYIDC